MESESVVSWNTAVAASAGAVRRATLPGQMGLTAFQRFPAFRLIKRAPAESTARITLPLVTVMAAGSLLGSGRGALRMVDVWVEVWTEGTAAVTATVSDT